MIRILTVHTAQPSKTSKSFDNTIHSQVVSFSDTSHVWRMLGIKLCKYKDMFYIHISSLYNPWYHGVLNLLNKYINTSFTLHIYEYTAILDDKKEKQKANNYSCTLLPTAFESIIDRKALMKYEKNKMYRILHPKTKKKKKITFVSIIFFIGIWVQHIEMESIVHPRVQQRFCWPFHNKRTLACCLLPLSFFSMFSQYNFDVIQWKLLWILYISN